MRMNRTMYSGIWIFSIFILCCKKTSAQDSASRTTKPVFAHVSLLYDFPESFGLTLGINLPLEPVIKNTISKNGRTFIKQKDIVTGLNASFYRYVYNYSGIILLPFIAMRHYIHPSVFSETALAIGVLRTFYDGRVYKVDASGTVREINLFGRFYAATSLSWAFNWLLQKTDQSNIALQLKPALWFQYPYNSFIKPHLSLEAGIQYQISSRNVLIRTKNKS